MFDVRMNLDFFFFLCIARRPTTDVLPLPDNGNGLIKYTIHRLRKTTDDIALHHGGRIRHNGAPRHHRNIPQQ